MYKHETVSNVNWAFIVNKKNRKQFLLQVISIVIYHFFPVICQFLNTALKNVGLGSKKNFREVPRNGPSFTRFLAFEWKKAIFQTLLWLRAQFWSKLFQTGIIVYVLRSSFLVIKIALLTIASRLLEALLLLVVML